MHRNRQPVTAPILPASDAFGQSLEPHPAQMAFEASTAQFLDFYNTAPVGYITLDFQGMVLDANLATCNLLGVSRMSLVGQALTHFIASQDQDAFYLFRKQLITNSLSQSIELRLSCSGSPPLWVRVFITDAKDTRGAPVQRIVLVDISERKKVQKLLEESELRFRSLIENLQVGVMLQGTKAEVLLSNGMTQNLLGFTESQLAGKTSFDPEWDVIHESGEPFPGPSHPTPQAILTGRPFHNVVMGVYNSKLGERKWLSVNADPQFNADGAVQQVVCTLTDISARKLIEAELKRASLAADTANAAKSRFLAAASHDLRQPLSALSLFVSVLRNKAGPDLQGLVGNFQDCVDSLDELLTDLLDISKLEAGAVFWRSANFSVDEFFLALQSVSLVRIQKKHLRMRTRHSDFVAYTDRTLLRRIVGNFVDNAIRYTNQGGVLIACRPHAGKQWIEVWDTGIGIPQDKLTVIFEEFSQLGDGARTQGSGLGLAIARQTANLLGLQIRVRSRLGRGSMFAIELPQGKLENLAPAPLEAASITKKFKIAVLDDNDRVGQAVKMMLEGVGHIVVAATKLSELLVKISTSRPDILVCDYRLTDGHTGFDAIAAVRSLLGPDFPAIIFTGDTDPTLIKSMSRQGVPVLYKPIRADALQAAICAAIESKLP